MRLAIFGGRGAMPDLQQRIQNGLNETRILILGAQVLLVFNFRAVFEPGFQNLSPAARDRRSSSSGWVSPATCTWSEFKSSRRMSRSRPPRRPSFFSGASGSRIRFRGASPRERPGKRTVASPRDASSGRGAVGVAADADRLRLSGHLHFRAPLAAELAVAALDAIVLAAAALVFTLHKSSVGRSSTSVLKTRGPAEVEIVRRRCRILEQAAPAHAHT